MVSSSRLTNSFYTVGKLRFPGTNVTEDITDSKYTIDYTSGLGFRLPNPLPPGVPPSFPHKSSPSWSTAFISSQIFSLLEYGSVQSRLNAV